MSDKMHFDSRAEALKVGKQKKALLANPKGWRVNVWENLGWHLSLIKGNLHLHYSPYNDSFMAFLSENAYGGDSMFWHETFYNKDPNKVIAHKIKVAQEFIDTCQAIVDAIKK